MKIFSSVLGFAITLALAAGAAHAINAGSSSNYSLDTTNKRVSPSTTNVQIGTAGLTLIGNMTSGGGLAASFDGTTSQSQAASSGGGALSVSGFNNTVGVDWGSGVTKTVTRFRIYGPNNANILGGGGGTTYKLQGSNDNSSWTDLTSGLSFPTGTSQNVDTTSGITTTTAYRFHQVNFNGNGANSVATAEVQFYEPVFNDMVLTTVYETSDSTVSAVRVLAEIDNSASPTLNVDLILDVTCDGGVHWATATASSAGRGQAGRLAIETAVTTCSTSGTSFGARFSTHNGKNITLHGVSVSAN